MRAGVLNQCAPRSNRREVFKLQENTYWKDQAFPPSIRPLAANSTAIIRVELKTDQFSRYHEDGLIGFESAMVEAAPGFGFRFVDLSELHHSSCPGSGHRNRSRRRQGPS